MPKPFFRGANLVFKNNSYIYQEHGVEVDYHQMRKREAKHVDGGDRLVDKDPKKNEAWRCSIVDDLAKLLST
jgi:hypothetical protein